MPDPRVIALDIETHGAVDFKADGTLMPPQTLFNPIRCLYCDDVSIEDMIVTLAITTMKEDPRCPTQPTQNSTSSPPKPPMFSVEQAEPSRSAMDQTRSNSVQSKAPLPSWDRQSLMKLQPSETFVIKLSNPSDRAMAIAHLEHADTLIGAQIWYDILMLRVLPDFREVLAGPHAHTLLELQVFNYLHSEIRPERSLKPLGPILGTHQYTRSLKDGRFHDENDPKLHGYNGADTVNTTLSIAELARRIDSNFPNTDKLSPFCIQYFSDTIWSGIRMTEAGIPMSHSKLLSLQTRLEAEMLVLAKQSIEDYDLILKGKGRDKGPHSRQAFIDKVLDAVPPKYGPYDEPTGFYKHPHNPLLQHELLERTKVLDQISWSIINRSLFKGHLPDDHPLQVPLDLADRYSKHAKIVESYTRTLLDRHHRPKKSCFSDIIIPQGLQPCLQNRLPTTVSPPPPPTKTPASSASSSKSSAVKKISTWSPPTKNGGSKSHTTNHQGLQTAPKSPTSHPATSQQIMMQTPATHLGRNLDSWLAYPSCYIVPSPFADMSSDEGGQQQARMSMKEPSAPTWPKIVYNCMQSRWEGGVILKMDYSLHEFRIVALLSGDEGLLKALADGVDLHDDMALDIFGPDVILRDEAGDRTKEGQCAKHVGFTDLNAGGAGMLQATILKKSGIFKELSWCEEMVAGRYRRRPGLVTWQRDLVMAAQMAGIYVLPETGHSRYYLAGEETPPGEIISLPIQATAAIVLHCTVHRLQSKHLPPLNDPDPDCYLFLNRYDEFDLDCRTPAVAKHYATCIDESVHYVATEGYWARMQERFGRKVAIVHKITIGDPTP